jgi:uncharacterized protein with von Willebrand factor type A (vWA) domain
VAQGGRGRRGQRHATAPVDYHCRSDFGYAFSRFCRTELDSLDRRTTILVLGDARNNYNDPQAWALRLIRERVKGIVGRSASASGLRAS